jgi:hypothetical protein
MFSTLTLTPAPVVSGFGLTLLLSLFCLRRREHLRQLRIQCRLDRNLRTFVASVPPPFAGRKRQQGRTGAAEAGGTALQPVASGALEAPAPASSELAALEF